MSSKVENDNTSGTKMKVNRPNFMQGWNRNLQVNVRLESKEHHPEAYDGAASWLIGIGVPIYIYYEAPYTLLLDVLCKLPSVRIRLAC